MSIEYNPVGVTCNLSCPYCYEHPMRDAGNYVKPNDIEAVREALLAEGSEFTIFGGEPLLAAPEHLEEMWEFGIEQYGSNSIQTNGVLITDEHIEMFKKYKVHVGISLDGPGELNDSRWRGTIDATRKATAQTHENIDKLLEAGITPSLIVTLHQGNVRQGGLQRMKEWLIELDGKGIWSVRLHLLEVDHQEVDEAMKLSDEENYKALIELHQLQVNTLKKMQFDVFSDIERLMKSDDQMVTCVWNACDPYTTSAVRGVDANGDRHNCGRTNKDGVNWFKSDQVGHERQLGLYHTDWKDGGCKGCRFFILCKGQCPGTGGDADWRNKSDLCFVWYKLFEYMEQHFLEQGRDPISLHPGLKQIEAFMLRQYAKGQYTNVATAKRAVESRNTHSNSNQPAANGNRAHGDRPHGDSHGDHYDSNQSTEEAQTTLNDNRSHGDRPHGDSHGDSNHK